MNVIRINGWYGRLNNNIIQLLNCIRIAEGEGYNVIQFPNHQYLSSNSIVISNNNYEKKPDMVDNFYYYFMNKGIESNFQKWREYFQKYIKNILKFNLAKSIETCDVVIYMRGNDMLCHRNIPQPPLSFYKQIVDRYKDVRLICEDLTNPCAKWLVDNKLVTWKRQSLEDDILYMTNAKVLSFAHGTFCFLPLLITYRLEELWIADFIAQQLYNHWKIKHDTLTHMKINFIEISPEFYTDFDKSKYGRYIQY